MITRGQAEDIAARVVGVPADDPTAGWKLQEFDSGWLIREAWLDNPDAIGGTVRVVERENGRVLKFPSSVPTQRILTQYARVVRFAWVQDMSARTEKEPDGDGSA